MSGGIGCHTETTAGSRRFDFMKSSFEACAFQAELQWDDLNWEKRSYSAFGAYQQSKLANVLFSAELASKLEGTGVRSTRQMTKEI